MEKIQRSNRNSNLEILRIISIIFIIAHHFSVHGFENVNFAITNVNSFLIYFFAIFGEIGVDVFILISAYFMINSSFTFKKLLILGGEVYFYSIVFFVLFLTILTPVSPINLHFIISSVLPISQSTYWFITDYLLLMIFSPFLNKFIKSLSKNDFLKILFLMLIIFCVFPTFQFLNGAFNPIILFIILYFIGSFIRLHLNIDKFDTKFLILIFFVCMVISFLLYSGSSVMYLITNIKIFDNILWSFLSGNSIFILLSSLSLFLVFLKRESFSNKYINFIAGSSLGVYLIHENIFMREYLWQVIIKTPTYYSSNKLIIVALISISIIFVICTLIDITRRLTIEKLWIYIIDVKLNNIGKWLYAKFETFCSKFEFYFKI